MNLSVFDLFKIGIGPSSSHTVGPMWAAVRFAQAVRDPDQVARVKIDLYGSLALTGRGHCTDKAVLLGLSGEKPDTVDPDVVDVIVERIRKQKKLRLNGAREIPFDESRDLIFHETESLPFHPNGMRFSVYDKDGKPLQSGVYFSVGGGFVVTEEESTSAKSGPGDRGPAIHEFHTAEQLMAIGRKTGKSIVQILSDNERVWRKPAEVDAGLDRIWAVMNDCIERGCRNEGILPGGLEVKRRAPALYRTLTKSTSNDPLKQLDWVSLFALAVNEENAAGGQVVTAPTNGAAGVIPAVMAYYVRFVPGANAEGIRTFMLTAAAIGMLYKTNASLSAAEMGCQGEVGVACSMAAAGLAAVMGGTNAQIENAAEIGMEHNLGLTCDPIKGLVQVPCIERNTMGAVKAINAARLAVLHGDGSHRVSLDRVIETMRQTGVDMQAKYKETSLGGLAVNVVEC